MYYYGIALKQLYVCILQYIQYFYLNMLRYLRYLQVIHTTTGLHHDDRITNHNAQRTSLTSEANRK